MFSLCIFHHLLFNHIKVHNVTCCYTVHLAVPNNVICNCMTLILNCTVSLAITLTSTVCVTCYITVQDWNPQMYNVTCSNYTVQIYHLNCKLILHYSRQIFRCTILFSFYISIFHFAQISKNQAEFFSSHCTTNSSSCGWLIQSICILFTMFLIHKYQYYHEYYYIFFTLIIEADIWSTFLFLLTIIRKSSYNTEQLLNFTDDVCKNASQKYDLLFLFSDWHNFWQSSHNNPTFVAVI